MSLEAASFEELSAQYGIHLPTLRDPVNLVGLAEGQYLSGIWRNESLGAPFGREIAEMLQGNITKVVAATDNPKKAALYGHAFDSYNLAMLGSQPVRVEYLSEEQKKDMGPEPAWNNVLYVAAHKNMLARRQRPDGNAMVFSTDILTGAVMPDGSWKIFHKLGRIEDLRQEDLEQRAEEIADIMSAESKWFWLSGTAMQNGSGLMLAGRYYQADFRPVDRRAIHSLFVRDFQRGRAQSIPHGLDVLTDLEDYAREAVGIGVTWPMMNEDRTLGKELVYEHVERKLQAGEAKQLTVRNLNAMMLSGVPALDGIKDIHWTRAQSADYLEKVMLGWVEEDEQLQ